MAPWSSLAIQQTLVPWSIHRPREADIPVSSLPILMAPRAHFSLLGPADHREKRARLSRTLLEQGHLPLVGWENVPKPLSPPEPSSPPQLNGDN